MKEIQVKLDGDLQYAYDGSMTRAEFMLIKKPTAKQIHLTTVIRSIFQSNLLEQTKRIKGFDSLVENAKQEAVKNKAKETKDKKKDDDKMDTSDCINILYLDPDNVEKLVITFSELMRTGLFLIDGEVTLTKPLIDSIDEDDFNKLFGSFVANFTFASLMKQ